MFKILIVEDDVIIHSMIEELLKEFFRILYLTLTLFE